jgi:Flp pilus assembly protein TadG
MMRNCQHSPHCCLRCGSALVETAIVLPILVVLFMGAISMGMDIYYYQHVAALAREGARYAMVHGSEYASETGGSAATSDTIKSNVVSPMAIGLASTGLTVTANPSPVGAQGTRVQVTVSYSWTPLLYVTGTFTLSSTSEMVVAY